ncbi:MAG: hypothetical protein U9N34_03850, partial [Candidatus Cloacimonadota bacterium]|nr:hypothetical protein [Candidatus Cloacimonadota bacterium]
MSYHYFEILKENLEEQILKHNLQHKEISIKCKILTPEEAIGNPDKDDFPIIKGKEKMIEASF